MTSWVQLYNPGYLRKGTEIQGRSGIKTRDSNKKQLEMFAVIMIAYEHIKIKA